MPLLAYEPERLAALRRALDDLEFALTRVHQSLPPDISSNWGSIRRDLARFRAHKEKIEGVLRSDVPRAHWANAHGAHLHNSALAQSAKNTLINWVTTHPSWWAKATHGHPTDIDSLVRSLHSNPPAAAAFIDSVEDVAPLIYGAHDTDLVRAFWLLVTDPTTTPPEIAGQRIRSLLDTVFGDHEWTHALSKSSIVPHERRRIEQSVIDMLGDIVAPWQFSFSGLAADWGWSPSEGISRLRTVAASSRAAADLARGIGPSVVRTLSHLPPDPAHRLQHIDNVALAIGASLEIVHEAGLNQAGRDRASWQTLDELIDLAPVNAPWPFSILVGRGASWLDDRLFSHQNSPTEILKKQHDTLTSQQVLAGLAVLTVWRSQWSTHWRTGSRSPASPTLSRTAAQRELLHTYDAIDSPSARGRVLAR